MDNIVTSIGEPEERKSKLEGVWINLHGDGKFTALNKFLGLPGTRIGSIQIRFTGRDVVPSPRSSSPNYYRRSAVWYLRY